MDNIFSQHARQHVEPADFLDLVSYRNQQHNITNLRAVVGDEKYILLLDKFAGSYTRFPTPKNVLLAIDEILLAQLWVDLKEKSGLPGLIKWNEAETRFVRQGTKMGLDYKQSKRRATTVLKELLKARTWANLHEVNRMGPKP